MSSTVTFADTGGAQTVTVTQQFKNAAGTLVDPTTISITVTDPQGGQITYTFALAQVVKVSTGIYSMTIPALLDGLWSFFWIATGSGATVQAGTFTVEPETVGRWYTSVQELKSRVGITDTQDDFECNLAVQAAAAWIEQFTGRFFWNQTGTRTYRNHSIYDVDIDDVVSVTTLKTDGDGDGVFETVWTASQFQLEVTEHEYNTASKGEPWPFTKIQALGTPGGNYLPYVWAWSHQDRVQVTGLWGWLQVPTLVRQASLQLSADYLKLKDAPFGIVGFADYGAIRVRDNPQIASMLRRYVKPGVKVGV